jgi:hypothetical protein
MTQSTKSLSPIGAHRQQSTMSKSACRSNPRNAFGKKADSFTLTAGIWRTMEVTADGLWVDPALLKNRAPFYNYLILPTVSAP